MLNSNIFILTFEILLLSVCNLAACQEKPKTKVSVPVKEIYFFIDKSKSVSFNDQEIKNKVAAEVDEALNLFENDGDKIYVYYIHSNTSGASPVLTFTTPPYNLPKNSNTIERNNYKKRYKINLKKQRDAIKSSVLACISKSNISKTQNATDVFAVLEVLSNETKTNCEKFLYILSDGIQTVNNLIARPKSIKEAKLIANSHYRNAGDFYDIQTPKIQKTKARMILPYSSISSNHNKLLNIYWAEVFRLYGADIEFN